MNRTRTIIAISGALALTVAIVYVGGCTNGCTEAEESMRVQIDDLCLKIPFKNSSFCTCCVANGFYNIDDSCKCQPLVLDADFCFYDDGSRQRSPGIEAALEHATAVCEGKNISVPYGDAGGATCFPSTSAATSSSTGSPSSSSGPGSSSSVAASSSQSSSSSSGGGGAAGAP